MHSTTGILALDLSREGQQEAAHLPRVSSRLDDWDGGNHDYMLKQTPMIVWNAKVHEF